MAINKNKRQRQNRKLKKEHLTTISGIMKGILIYKEDMVEIGRLKEKYPSEFNLNIAYATA